MSPNEKEHRKALRNQYENRHPEMGVVCWKNREHMWIGASKDIRATYNGIEFQLKLGSLPNKALQAAYNADPDALEWSVLKHLDYEDPTADYSDDLELLLMEAFDEFPNAQRISTRKL